MPKKKKLQVELSTSLVAVILPVLTRVKALFDLAADPVPIAERLGNLNKGQSCWGLRVPGAFDGFEVAVRAVLGQQVSVKAASTLMARLVATHGEPVETPVSGLTRLTPTPEKIVQCTPESLTALGILASRARTIRAIAQAALSENLQLHNHADIQPTVAALKALPGIGDWTAQYIALRVLADPDAFPSGDLALRRALGVEKPSQALKIAETWRPWRAYAAMYLWTLAEEAT